MRYRKKPVVIEAVQYDGNFRCLDIFSIHDVGKFIIGYEDDGSPYLIIPTLEGGHKCSKGDYVIRGIKGEYYPCKPDIFEMTYERDEPTVIQAPIKNYDPWDEVINQLGEPNEMIDHIGDTNKMVEDDVKKLADEHYTIKDRSTNGRKESFIIGYNKAKETFYTEEQMKLAFEYGKSLEPFDSFEDFIQSLKQPKQ